MQFYYNRQGQPISNEQWQTEFARADRRVAWDDLGKLGRVSTVWLGLNHAYDDGPPLIFETMVFDGPLHEYMERYSTEDQALVGHEFTVMRLTTLRATKPQPLLHNGRKPRK